MAEKRVSPRVVAHVNTLREAGLDTEKFFSALVAIRDDSTLSNAQRTAIYRMIAMESYVWYLEALRGEPVDRLKLLAEAAKVAEENSAAIKKRTPGDSSLALANADITAKPKEAQAQAQAQPGAAAPKPAQRTPPKPGPTTNMRPPPKKK